MFLFGKNNNAAVDAVIAELEDITESANVPFAATNFRKRMSPIFKANEQKICQVLRKLSAREVVLRMLEEEIYNALAGGEFRVCGVVTGEGQEAIRLYDWISDEMVRLGKIDQATADQSKTLLRDSIRRPGVYYSHR